MSKNDPCRRALTLLAAAFMTATVVSGARAESHQETAKKAAATAAPAGKAGMKTDPAQDAMMAEMMKYAMPGPKHEWLKKAEGKWNATVKMWSAPGEPTVSKGTSENRMILGGRYLEQRFKGTFMEMPFEGYGLLGYDNKKNEYTSLWVDNTSTAMMTGSGGADETGKVVTMKSVMDGPDGKPMESRTVTKVVDDNTHVFSMYAKMGDQEMLMMEITYTRAQ